jgi:ribonuclease HI
MKHIGTYLLPYIRIGGNTVFPPPFTSLLQADGSYIRRKGRVAMILTSGDRNTTYRDTFEIKNALSSTEMEWASIAKGIEFALQKGHQALSIENDNFGVVSALLVDSKPKQEYAKYYKHTILQLTKQTLWTGIRWVPRDHNEAETLFLT